MTTLAKQQTSVGIIKINNVNSKELAIYNANNTELKLKDFSTKTDLALLNSHIVKWQVLIGAKKMEAFEINIISNHIKKNHPTFNIFDIEEAINLSVSEKIAENIEHYGTLTASYASRVFKAYQVYKGIALHNIREELERIKREKVELPSDEERLKSFKDLLQVAKNWTKNETELYYDFGDILYYFFWKNNLVTKPMPKDFEKEALEYGEKMLKIKTQNASLKAVINGVGFNHTVRTTYINEYARTFAVNRWIKEADIESIIKKLTIDMINLKK